MDLEPSASNFSPMSNPAELFEHCATHTAGLVHIKPKVVFMKIEAGDPTPVSMKINVPSSNIGSVTLLEAATLVSLVKLVKPRKIFEFGTFLGYSTSLLVENSADDCAVYSLDLGDSHVSGKPLDSFAEADLRSDGDINDEYLRGAQGALGPHYTRSLSAADKPRLCLLQQDSRTFDPAAHGLDGSVDIVFVDGGHDTETVTIDTANARKMIGDSGLIVWHDFNSNIHDDVTTFVKGLAKHEVVVCIQHTMLAILLVGKAGRDFLKIGV
ncbi:class I SAM-dependent methyltransferase [Phenylobacterium sp.]|uniref:class I SAM-dependent methyltransferase n=1 Tax=Phenylobacterium sp. TaxID=1871053 RepID=UPI0012046E4C|nr:class I SAM-dependent methyltransferase [Phenylobacterium sp.]THD70590.1 MAG: class I SAM-dependent methyltransferase [Phenylobacterium sp.]